MDHCRKGRNDLGSGCNTRARNQVEGGSKDEGDGKLSCFHDMQKCIPPPSLMNTRCSSRKKQANFADDGEGINGKSEHKDTLNLVSQEK